MEELPLEWLSVFMADGDTLSVIDDPEVRRVLEEVITQPSHASVWLPLLVGVHAHVRASEIQGWAPNTPSVRFNQRRFQARAAAEDKAFDKEQEASTQSESWR